MLGQPFDYLLDEQDENFDINGKLDVVLLGDNNLIILFFFCPVLLSQFLRLLHDLIEIDVDDPRECQLFIIGSLLLLSLYLVVLQVLDCLGVFGEQHRKVNSNHCRS